jgi:hypothetical protein
MITIKVIIPESIRAKLKALEYSDIEIESIFSEYVQSLFGFPYSILNDKFDEWLSLKAQQSSK